MQDCLSKTLSNSREGGAVTCYTGEDLEESQGPSDNTSQSSKFAVQIMLVGGAEIFAVSLLL
jgi:hypothetical protein